MGWCGLHSAQKIRGRGMDRKSTEEKMKGCSLVVCAFKNPRAMLGKSPSPFLMTPERGGVPSGSMRDEERTRSSQKLTAPRSAARPPLTSTLSALTCARRTPLFLLWQYKWLHSCKCQRLSPSGVSHVRQNFPTVHPTLRLKIWMFVKT